MTTGKKVLVKQINGKGGHLPATVRTLEALGLGRIGKSREFTLNPAIAGMIRRVAHLVVVTPVGK